MISAPLDFAKRQLTLLTHRIHALPVVVLMPHSRCDCRCVMCDIWKANQRKQELSRADIERHVAVFRDLGVQWVVLSGGEALLHRDLWSLCALLKDAAVRITLLSTGMQLATHATQVARWCDEVIVSIDGSADVHDRVRNTPRAFARLAAGVAALRSARAEMRVTGRSVLQRLNYAYLPHIIEAAHDLTLDQISFLAADVSSSAFNRPDGWTSDRADAVTLTDEEVKAFTEIVERVIVARRDDFAAGFIAESPDKLRRLPRYYAALLGLGEFPPIMCNAPWTSAVIEADGAVRPCFFHRILGNVHERPLDAILNSPEAIDFRRTLDVHADPICRRCVCTLHLPAAAALSASRG